MTTEASEDAAAMERLEEEAAAIVARIKKHLKELLEMLPDLEESISAAETTPRAKTENPALQHQRITPFTRGNDSLTDLFQFLGETRERDAQLGIHRSAPEIIDDMTEEQIHEIHSRMRQREAAEKERQPENGDSPATTADPPKPADTMHSLYRTKDKTTDNLIHPKNWPGTKCRLLQRLLDDDDEREDSSREKWNRGFTILRLLHRDTKRIILNPLQFEAFCETAARTDHQDAFDDLRWPFDDVIYVEFREPFTGVQDDIPFQADGFMVIGDGPVRTVCLCLWEDEAFTPRSLEMDVTTGREILPPYLLDIGQEPDPILPAAICMTMAHMTARGMELVEEPLHRAARRRLQREQGVNPWYVIRSQNPSPRYRPSDQPQKGTPHGHRYDVIGHFRMIRRENEDGDSATKRVWVKPHQRGLKNDLYIPGTRSFTERRKHDEKHSEPPNPNTSTHAGAD